MLRDRVMRGCGTDEPWFREILPGQHTISVNWRKPLRMDEVNRMAETAEVRGREGRG
jgi:hypothetical protein